MNQLKPVKFDRTNLIISIGVFLISAIIYGMTVQRSFSFWDCGEFIAASYILGIPHPPGTPLFVLIGRIFSLIPFVDDISYRVNYISVITSAFTAMFSYLLITKIVRYFFKDPGSQINKIIGYIGGISGAFFVAFSRTNWSNSVEAEVYGMALALSVLIVYLTIIYLENQGTATATKALILVFYLAILGVGVHMTVYLVIPACAIFFVLNKKADALDWFMISSFLILELIIVLFLSISSNNKFIIFLVTKLNGFSNLFYLISGVLAAALLVFLYKKINWAVFLAIGAVSTIMVSFALFYKGIIVAVFALIIMGIISKTGNYKFQWKTGLMILLVAIIGFSVHLYIPIQSSNNPRIDENNPSRSLQTFEDFLDRKQYGQVSMVERMFQRRGDLANQFGRHAHMGFWSYFEEQYSNGGITFIPFFLLGLLGIGRTIYKRPQIGMPLLALLTLCSVGLILYMNFADGTTYNEMTGDAYLEVRDRDYFFTPAFVFFGIAMGIGIAAIIAFIRDHIASKDPGLQKTIVMASAILIFLPGISLAKNYHACDRSNNFLPINYAKNILDTCEENAILFTAGDNDTFPLWCLQEVYDYRKDVVVCCMSLLNTDWYVEQMKNRYNLPISLTDEQILWYPFEIRPDVFINRPKEKFYDRPRKRQEYLNPNTYAGQMVRVQDMILDEIVIENLWKRPIYFSSPPYDSPLNLRERTISTGIIYQLKEDPVGNQIDIDKGLDLYMNTYLFDGFENSDVYRDENATGVYISLGVNAIRVFDGLVREERKEEAEMLAQKIIKDYPEYWQMYFIMSDYYKKENDTAKGQQLIQTLHDTLTAFLESNPENLFYMQDLGMAKINLGETLRDEAMKEEGLRLLYDAFYANPNSSFAFRKLASSIYSVKKDPIEMSQELRTVAKKFGEYKINRTDELYMNIMGYQSQGR